MCFLYLEPACHLLAATLCKQLRVVLDPRGHMGILSHTDRGIRELINRGEALAGFWGEGKVGRLKAGSGQASLPELLLETMGSIIFKA